MNDKGASDLYLTVGFPPALRIEQTLLNLRDTPITVDELNEIIGSIFTSRQRRDFEAHMELNTSLDVGKFGRYRVNALRQRQFPALVIRRIISKIPSFSELRLPENLAHLAMERRGLILVTGMTGSGKSTTLASMIDYRNSREQGHIITIEDPIEYFHEHKKSVITQREIGVDTESFSVALKNALRQRPDVILVGEVRDREVMEQALTAAETGHLCLATLHTNNTYQSIERIVNLFPEDYHAQIRLNLSMNLRGIVSQRLVPAIGGGMVVAIEVMLNQGLIRDLIHKGEITKIKDVMEQNNPIGMCTFDQSLLRLFADGLIAEETAITQADLPGDMKIRIQQVKMGKSGGDAFKSIDTSSIKLSD
ncbi:Twitching motility protein PilT [Micavibrio aeruginosavorus EPB]|uniref:Twitching motility protein PilT n=2 Tax=Micavibrio aeruginosavorus TaxID=349221 RepID=M4VFX3_9BACT|nr:Twitching motility protein PilT [Micavibrio aeruginosavorus EPB]